MKGRRKERKWVDEVRSGGLIVGVNCHWLFLNPLICSSSSFLGLIFFFFGGVLSVAPLAR